MTVWKYGRWIFLIGVVVWGAIISAQAADDLIRREWMVEGIKREALLHVPAAGGQSPWPVVLVFHGQGGSMREASWNQPMHQAWPEALVVYLQGLPTVGRLTDAKGEQAGWQAGPGLEGDRDLKFVDAVLGSLRKDYAVDAKRIYATGHSQGGAFTYLLWATRREWFAAFGPSAAVAGRDFGKLEPAPVIQIAGENDELVRFPWQKLMIKVLCRTNRCGAGETTADGRIRYDSAIGAPVEVYVHPGGHRYPAKATALIAAFFKANARP